MTISLAKGTPVISLADGSRLGTIDHVYFDPVRMELVGFTFHQDDGLFGRGSSGFVEITDVHAFGADSVTITDVSTVRSELVVESYKNPLLDLEELLNRTVMTESGIHVGHVRSIQFRAGEIPLVSLEVDDYIENQSVHFGAGWIQTIGAEFIIIEDVVPAAASRAEGWQPLRVIQSHPRHAAPGNPASSRPVADTNSLD